MSKHREIRNHALTIFLILGLVTPFNAYAYIDPGAGSLMLQMLIAGIISGLAVIRLYWARLRDSFNRLFKRAD